MERTNHEWQAQEIPILISITLKEIKKARRGKGTIPCQGNTRKNKNLV